MSQKSKMNERGPRSANYSAEEVRVLVELVGRYRSIIECKESDANIWREKMQAWEELGKEFNEKAINVPRSGTQLRKKYEGLKKSVKEKCRKMRQELYKTGIGPPYKTVLSLVEESILEIMKQDFDGLKSPYDTDYKPGSEESSNVDISESSIKTAEESFLWGSNYCSVDIGTPLNPVMKRQKTVAVGESNTVEEAVVIAVPDATARDPITHSLDNNFSIHATDKKEVNLLRKRRDRAREKIGRWAETKTELITMNIESQQKKTEREEEEHRMRMSILEMEKAHKMEEHQLKMKLLNAELAIKEATLENLKSSANC